MKPLTTKIKYLDNLILGILAGIAIGLGGFLNLLLISTKYEGLRFLGGFVFSIGLFSVCFFGFHLYTGKIGYLIENKIDYILSLFIMYIGNIIGVIGFGYLLRLTDLIQDTAYNVAISRIIKFEDKNGQSILRMLLYSAFCGIMVFLAVDIFKKSKNWIIKVGGLVVCVGLFIITGMEHCIADMFYFAYSNIFKTNFMAAFVALLIATIGNSIGSIATYIVVQEVNRKQD